VLAETQEFNAVKHRLMMTESVEYFKLLK